ncbi:MAG: UDP-N-acetylmuramoyl-tripeptide--D-alanyl-D-alanine ligase [Bryobacteraceae bacterium]|jgi:UDP-N-acetylmuramoyl-tripeptide--D-alanyl-D-alanine ligase
MRRREYLRRAGLSLWHFKCFLMYLAAFLWRRLLFRTTFIAITGSMGKTTAKECLAAALSSRFPTAKTFGNQNDYWGVPRSLLRVRPWHRFAVIEVATARHGLMKRSARLVRPDVAVVLNVARAHVNNFRTLDGVAAEKAELLAALPAGAVAVLNGDDPRVAAMANPSRHRITWFGSSPAFDFQAECLSSRWPERFSFRLRAGSESRQVQTRLLGTHWKDSVLGALAAAHVCGVALSAAVESISLIEPGPGTMQPNQLPCGAIVIRDELSGSIGTLRQALEVLAQSSAARKLLVISDVTDTSQKPRKRLAQIGREAAAVAGSVVFIGDRAGHGVRGAVAAGMDPQSAHGFGFLQAAAEFLKAELRPGDLVLLKGRTTLHLSRIYFAQIGTVECWKVDCEKTFLCDRCPELGARPYPASTGLRSSDA